MQKSEIIDCYKKLSILGDEQEDIEIQRSQLDSRLRTTEELVGLGLTHVWCFWKIILYNINVKLRITHLLEIAKFGAVQQQLWRSLFILLRSAEGAEPKNNHS